jgi:hypothetical protein
MRSVILLSLVVITGCATHRKGDIAIPTAPAINETKVIHLKDYSGPFGSAPNTGDLSEVFLSLPNQLAGDMTTEIRKGFIEQCSTDTVNHMFDRTNRFLTYFNDNPYNPYQASSIFSVKILPSRKYKYIVAIHLEKPFAPRTPPAASNTFFLAPKDSQWIDISENVLPREVERDWYYQLSWSNNVIEVGPYEATPRGYWQRGKRKFDLLWTNDHFKLQKPSTSHFTNQ